MAFVSPVNLKPAELAPRTAGAQVSAPVCGVLGCWGGGVPSVPILAGHFFHMESQSIRLLA